jgi:hypothetical protein
MSKNVSKTSRKKPCKTCKKKEKLELGVEVPQDEIVLTKDDILKAWGYLNQFEVPKNDPIKMDFLKKTYREITGTELDERRCISCHMATIKRKFKNNANVKYDTNIR